MKFSKKKTLDKELKLISLYKKKQISDFKKIKPRWAVDKYSVYATTHFKASLEDCEIFKILSKDLIKKADFGDMGGVPLNPNVMFNGVEIRDFRVAKILEHWDNFGFIDPPQIGIGSFSEIIFYDGRHRTLAAINLGCKFILIAIHFSDKKAVERILNLVPIVPR